MCEVHKPRVPNGSAFQQKLGPIDDVAKRRATPGPAQIAKQQAKRVRAKEETTLASDSDPPLRPEGLAEKGRRSPPTPTLFSDREYIEPLLTALLRPGDRSQLGNDRPGMPAR